MPVTVDPSEAPAPAAPAARERRKSVVLAVQIALGTACLAGFFSGAFWLLSGFSEPSQGEIRVGRADDWPEIRNGVPELAPARREGLAESPAASTAPAPASSVSIPPDEPRTTPEPFRGDEAPLLRPTATDIGADAAAPMPPAPSLPDAVASAGHEPEQTRALEAQPLPELPASVADASAAASARPAGADPRVSAAAEERPEAVAAQPPTAPAVPAPSARAAKAKADAPREPPSARRRPAERAGAQPVRPSPPARQASSGAAPRKAEPKTKTRQAAASPTGRSAPASPSATGAGEAQGAAASAAPPTDDDVRVLGIRLPSGRRIREAVESFGDAVATLPSRL